MLKISILIPAYNVEHWIDDCIRSCLNQNLKLGEEYEIIVVDDGSSDETLKRLRHYSNEIQIVSQENAGVSVARNTALQYAKGEYIWFIDGDDYIEPNVLRELYQYVKEKNLDVLTLSFNLVTDRVVYPKRIFYNPDSKSSINSFILQGHPEQIVACNTLCRLEYIKSHNIFFKAGIRYGEDTLWAFFVQLFDPKMGRIFNKIYNYRERKNSVMHSKDTLHQRYWFESMCMMMEVYIDVLDKYSDQLNKQKILNIKSRINWSSQNILFGALRLGKVERHKALNFLRTKGCYPYPILWDRLNFKLGLRSFLINGFQLFFPFKLYYL